ncbi:hypothetical protein B0F90DRAFT_1821615 [Multifurca ochricompacta]|uniref:Uncharacterized protein n=1 Tax=Multifurca ochricompacta TaxID=376703 RepID=A0AAD4LX25_9AGAM|nr:hypothetical protein B0F90DRAFT_1821615 [Multifurca ochricompacta]
MNDFVYSIPKATFKVNGQCLQIIQPTFGRLAFDAADDAAKRILLAQVQADQSFPADRKEWFLEYTCVPFDSVDASLIKVVSCCRERTSRLDMKMPNENFAIVRSSSVKSTVEDVGKIVLSITAPPLTYARFLNAWARNRISSPSFVARSGGSSLTYDSSSRPVFLGLFTVHFEQESDIAAVQSAFAALRKEKNEAVYEVLNDKAVDGNTASIEIQILSVEDDHDVAFSKVSSTPCARQLMISPRACFHRISMVPSHFSEAIEDVLSHPTSLPGVILEYAPNIGILSRSIAKETSDEVAQLVHRHEVLRISTHSEPDILARSTPSDIFPPAHLQPTAHTIV